MTSQTSSLPSGRACVLRETAQRIGIVSILTLGCLTALLVLAGCGRRSAANGAGGPVAVSVSKPVEREVYDFVDFTGRANAVKAVNVVARVSGYIMENSFKEGAEVKKGAVLVKLDAQPYQAAYDLAESQVDLNKAQQDLAKKIMDRADELMKKKAIAPEEYDQDKGALDKAVAQLKASEANLKIAKLNLDYTKVTSPITGKISRYFLTDGNLVNQNQTLLTTVVALDPMYVYFDVDEPTLERIKAAVNQGRMQSLQSGHVPVKLGLATEDGYPHQGIIDFINNQVNPTTGSIIVRGKFDNPKRKDKGRLLLPGMFVRIRLPIGEPHQGLLVIDKAITFDQTLKYSVYVVDANNKIQTRQVITGALQEDGLRVITKGLGPDDQVIVSGLLQLKPGMTVQPTPGPMPRIQIGAVTDTPANPQAAPPKTPKASSSK